MNLAKSYEFFQPEKLEGRVHILGCGSVGSTVAENLARYGITKFNLYDFDKVEPHNIVNQMFVQEDIGRKKVDAVADIITRINPDAAKDIKLFDQGFTGQRLSGYVFLCVDNIDLRREIAEANKTNVNIKAMFDFRTGLTDAQHFAAQWNDTKMVDAFINSMQFSHEDAMKSNPVSACNVTLSVAATVRLICGLGVANFINFARGKGINKTVLLNTEPLDLDVY